VIFNQNGLSIKILCTRYEAGFDPFFI